MPCAGGQHPPTDKRIMHGKFPFMDYQVQGTLGPILWCDDVQVFGVLASLNYSIQVDGVMFYVAIQVYGALFYEVIQVYGALITNDSSLKKKKTYIYIFQSYHYLGGNAKDQVGDNKAFGQ